MRNLCLRPKVSVRALCATAAALGGLASFAHGQGVAPAPAARLQPGIEQALHVRGATVANLQVADLVGVGQMVVVPMAGMNATLDMQPYSVRGPEYKLLEQRGDGRLYEVDPGTESTLRG